MVAKTMTSPKTTQRKRVLTQRTATIVSIVALVSAGCGGDSTSNGDGTGDGASPSSSSDSSVPMNTGDGSTAIEASDDATLGVDGSDDATAQADASPQADAAGVRSRDDRPVHAAHDLQERSLGLADRDPQRVHRQRHRRHQHLFGFVLPAEREYANRSRDRIRWPVLDGGYALHVPDRRSQQHA